MRFLKTAFLCLSFLVTFSIPSTFAESNKKITLCGTEGAKETFHGKWIFLIYQEAFKRLGYNLEYVEYKPK